MVRGLAPLPRHGIHTAPEAREWFGAALLPHFVACFLRVYPVFPRSLLDFSEVRSLQYVPVRCNRELTEGSPWTDDDNARRS